MKCLQRFFNIPMAVGVAIDDMGWVHSSDLKSVGGPPRLPNAPRDPNVNDYEDLIKISENSGTRLMGAFIMSEFDKSSILAKPEYNKPLALIDITEFGLDWHNNVTSEDAKVMGLLRNNSHAIEFALHGVRHGHFEDGKWFSSEWTKRPDVVSWDSENITTEIIAKAYTELIRQYFIEEELKFPESFVPPNHAYYYADNDTRTTGGILSKYGIKYVNFKSTGKNSCEYPFSKKGHFDNGVFILDRRPIRHCGFTKTGAKPKASLRNYPWIETHFNNFWGTENDWSSYLYNINSKFTRMLAKNTEQLFSQWLYREYASVSNMFNKLTIDNRLMLEEAYTDNILSILTLKIYLGKRNITEVSIDKDACINGYYKDKFGYGYLTIGHKSNFMGRLSKEVYTLTYKYNKDDMFVYVDNSISTFNIYSLDDLADKVSLRLKIYSKQTVKIKLLKEPKEVLSDNLNLLVDSYEYKDGFLYIRLKGKNMLGETGTISIIK